MEPLLADDAAIMVFRLVQEALTNIVKHAQASEVTVQIAVSDTELTVVVADNGVGIASDRRDAVGSHGLATMRHRVQQLRRHPRDRVDGRRSGTRLRARLPLALILRPQQPAALRRRCRPRRGSAANPVLEATDRGVA